MTKPPYSMTLEGFASAVGVSYETVRKWQSGETSPRERNLSSILRVLGRGATREWVMYGVGNPPSRAAISVADSSMNLVSIAAIPVLLWSQLQWVQLNNDDVALRGAPRVASARPKAKRSKRAQVPDNSMAPTLHEGDSVEPDPDELAAPGDIVLVKDRAGHYYLREFRERTYGFDAHPHNPSYATLESARDGLTVEAVATHYVRPLRRAP